MGTTACCPRTHTQRKYWHTVRKHCIDCCRLTKNLLFKIPRRLPRQPSPPIPHYHHHHNSHGCYVPLHEKMWKCMCSTDVPICQQAGFISLTVSLCGPKDVSAYKEPFSPCIMHMICCVTSLSTHVRHFNSFLLWLLSAFTEAKSGKLNLLADFIWFDAPYLQSVSQSASAE